MKKILIVDDDDDTVVMIKTMLEKEAYELVSACDGPKALEVLSHHTVDLILMDVCMPMLSGLWLSDSIKRKPTTKNVPIVIMSGLIDETTITRGNQIGVTDYLRKPFIAAELLDMIKKTLPEKNNA